MYNFFKKNWLILSIVFLAFVLRFWGSWYGLPGLFVGDEKSLVGGALKMIYQQNIFPVLEPDVFRILYYPTLIPWIYLIFFSPYVIFVYLMGDFASMAELRDFFIMDPSVFFMIARVVSVLFATGAVFLIYLAAKKIFNKRTGIIAALLYGVSFLPVHQGHFSKHWNVAMFFALLSMYFAFSLLKNNSKRNYVLAGLVAGLACFSNYLSVIYGGILIMVHFLFNPCSWKKVFFDKKLWLFVGVVLLVFGFSVLVNPYDFTRIAFGEDSSVGSVKTIDSFLKLLFEVLKSLYYLAIFVFIFSILGFLFLFFRNRKKFFILISIPFLSIFLYYFLYHFEPRYILFFLPILAIVAGFGLDQIIRILRIKSNLLISLILLAIIFIPLKNAIVFDQIISQDDTRNLAKDWVENNIPKGSKIITNSWEFVLIRNQECINQQQQTANMSLRSRDYVMMQNVFLDGYCVWPLDLIKILPDNIDEFEYYLIDSFTGRRSAHLGELLIEKGELIKEFKGSPFDPSAQNINMFVHQRLKESAPGPDVKIYQLK